MMSTTEFDPGGLHLSHGEDLVLHHTGDPLLDGPTRAAHLKCTGAMGLKRACSMVRDEVGPAGDVPLAGAVVTGGATTAACASGSTGA